MNKSLTLLIFIVITFSCSNEEIVEDEYTGPSAIAYDVHTNYTEKGSAKIKLDSPIQLEFEEGDKEFPEGIFLRMYKAAYGEKPYADLKADFAHYYSKKGHWKLIGNVIYRDCLLYTSPSPRDS